MAGERPFIVLEGLSGAGKTTLGRFLSEQLHAYFYATPPAPFRAIREAVDSGGDLGARYLFYLSGLYYAPREIRRLRQDRPVVCNRYALTTECFHRAAGLSIPFCHLALPLERPTLHVLIMVPEAVRAHRLEARGLSFNDRWERTRHLEHRLLAGYRWHHLVEGDNSSENPGDAVRQILGLFTSDGTGTPSLCLPGLGAKPLKLPFVRVETILGPTLARVKQQKT